MIRYKELIRRYNEYEKKELDRRYARKMARKKMVQESIANRRKIAMMKQKAYLEGLKKKRLSGKKYLLASGYGFSPNKSFKDVI